MKTIWGIAIIMCLVFVGCGEDRCGFVQEGDMLVNKTVCEKLDNIDYDIDWAKREIFALKSRVYELEKSDKRKTEIWAMANTHEIKQDEEIKTLQEDNTFLSNKINRNTQQDWELIMAILDYLELEREYYQSEFKLVKKEKGMR